MFTNTHTFGLWPCREYAALTQSAETLNGEVNNERGCKQRKDWHFML